MNTDWREQGQEVYLEGMFFTKKKYERFSFEWEHDHCEFCGVKFCELQADSECLTEGYASLDNYRWICESCFHDFQKKYKLQIKGQEK